MWAQQIEKLVRCARNLNKQQEVKMAKDEESDYEEELDEESEE